MDSMGKCGIHLDLLLQYYSRSMHTTEYHTHISVSGRAKESPTFFFTASRTLSDLAVLVINEEVRWTSNE